MILGNRTDISYHIIYDQIKAMHPISDSAPVLAFIFAQRVRYALENAKKAWLRDLFNFQLMCGGRCHSTLVSRNPRSKTYPNTS